MPSVNCSRIQDPRSRTIAQSLGVKFVDGSSDSVRIVGAHIGAAESTIAFLKTKLDATFKLMDLAGAMAVDFPRTAIAILRFLLRAQSQ